MEYISKRAAAEIVCDTVCGNAKGLCVCTPDQCQQGHTKRLYELPAADVAPVVHAHWIEKRGIVLRFCLYKWLECSNCQSRNGTMIKFNYCHNCGAKMDEET